MSNTKTIVLPINSNEEFNRGAVGSLPTAITNLSSVPGNEQVVLSWEQKPNAIRYHIYFNVAGSVTTADTKIEVDSGESSYTHTGLTNGTTYYYSITTLGGAGEATLSNEVSSTPGDFVNLNSLSFNGIDEYINLGDNYTFGAATAFSWSFWFKANNLAAQRALIAKTSQDANVYGYSLQHTASGKLFTQVRASGTLRTHTFTTTLSSATWYHICLTYAGGSNMNGLTAYINSSAEPAPTSSSLNNWTVTDPLTIGSRGTAFEISGELNQVTVWDKELSSSEVSELYNSGDPADPTNHSASSNLLSWWGLNDSSNFPIESDLVNSINGTLTNMEIEAYTSDTP